MKRMISILFAAILACALSLSALAAPDTIVDSGTYGENLTWELTEDGTLTISGQGEMEERSWMDRPWAEVSEVVNVVIEDGVTAIGDCAFYNFSSIQSVRIPDSVKSIGRKAFENCDSLMKIEIPDSVTQVGEQAFAQCRKLVQAEIGDGLTTIPEEMFTYSSSLMNVILGDNVERIEREAFSFCENLTEVVLPDSVTTIGEEAFYCCTGLARITLGENLEYICKCAFENCTRLSNIELPDGLVGIGDEAFQNCSSLPSITIPGSVKTVGSGAFGSCSHLIRVTIEEGVEELGREAFTLCRSLITISLPDTITRISDSTFAHCEDLTKVILGDKVTDIGEKAFFCCGSLTAVELPETLDVVYNKAFDCCSVLSDVYYHGSAAQWNNVLVVNDNDKLKNAAIHYNSKMPTVTNPFNDVNSGDYFYTPVLWALENNVTTGTSATTFSPNTTCNRAQVVTFLWRAMGSPEPESYSNKFVDVSRSDYYYKAVLWAVEKGITTGVDATHFGSDSPCTRGQVATFLWRANGKPGHSVWVNPFKDVSADSYYYDAILWAYESGITTGAGANSFAPENSCTRGQIVTFLYRSVV